MTNFPPSRRGLIMQVSLLILMTLLTILFAMLASQEPIGLRFTIYILAALLSFFPLPFLVYWLYSLTQANYCLDRERLTITWGLRSEHIPITEIEWVRPPEVLAFKLKMPFFHFPGAILGSRRNPDLGLVEFIASDVRSLLLVATSNNVYTISPLDRNEFMQDIQRAIELGSLSPTIQESIYPTFVLKQAWESLLARYLWLSGFLINIGLLVWVTYIIPSLEKIPLGFLPSGEATKPVPGAGLIMQPVISLLFYLVGWLSGLIFFRRQNRRPLAHILWASGVFSSLLFLFAVMLIVTTPV